MTLYIAKVGIVIEWEGLWTTCNVEICREQLVSRLKRRQRPHLIERLTVDDELVIFVLALCASTTEVSAPLIVGVWRRDHVVILYR